MFSVGASNVVSQLLIFFVGTHYARILGKDYFGNISVVQQIMVYFTMLTLFGLQTYGMREISKFPQNISHIAGDILFLRAILAFLSYVVIFIIAFFARHDKVFSILLLIYGATLLPSAINMDWIYMGIQKMEHNAVYNLLKNVILFALVFLYIKVPGDFFLIPVFTFSGLLTASIYQFYIYFFTEKFKLKIDINMKKILVYLKLGMPFLISGILAMINCNVDGIIIAFTRSKGEAGLYASAYYIVLFLTNVITILFTPVFPLLITLYYDKESYKLSILIDRLSKIIILLAMPIGVGGIILSKEIILLLFGTEYTLSHIPFRILMVYIFLLFIREIYGYGLNAWGKEKQYLKIVGISSSVNLILNLIFTPIFGMNIAAIITVSAEVLNLYLMKKNTGRLVSIKYAEYMPKVAAASLIMGIVITIMKHTGINVLLLITIGSLAYGISILFLKYTSIDEIKSFISKK